MNFHSFFILFNYSYKRCVLNFERPHLFLPMLYHFWLEKGKTLCRYEFCSFFVLFNYSYEMCVPNFEGFHPALPKLHYIWRGGARVCRDIMSSRYLLLCSVLKFSSTMY
jgi:hypothetical protein